MRITSFTVLGLSLLSLVLSGCAEPSVSAPTAAISTKFVLASEPAGAVDVLDVKEKSEDGQHVVVAGRLGGGLDSWIDGRAAFLLVDARIEPACADGDICALGCPGCTKEMMEASTMVKFLGEDGNVVPVDARQLLGVQDGQHVVVEGVASRDLTGNVFIAAQGVFIRK